MSNYDKAIDLYKHQHDRWNHWALFFFGLIASVFVIRNNAQQIIPIWVAALLASVLSAIWVIVAQSIRATTKSWLAIVKKLEQVPMEGRDDLELFQAFENELNKCDR